MDILHDQYRGRREIIDKLLGYKGQYYGDNKHPSKWHDRQEFREIEGFTIPLCRDVQKFTPRRRMKITLP